MIHKPVSLADQVLLRLETEILNGTYKRGEVLTELSLVEHLGVSRTPIREAVHMLAQEHIVEISQRGITVLGVSAEDIKDMYDVRLLVEPMAAKIAAATATAEELSALGEVLSLQEYYVSRTDSDHIKAQDSCFHELIYEATHSYAYLDTLLPLHKKTQKYRKTAVENQSRANASVLEHRAIFEALQSRDGEAAYAAMRRHVENARNHIVK